MNEIVNHSENKPMTTPQGMLELAHEIERSDGLYCMNLAANGYQLGMQKTATVIAALRQAAAPQGQEVREKEITRLATIEECARIADSFTCGSCGVDGKAGAAIRALAQAQEPGEDKQ